MKNVSELTKTQQEIVSKLYAKTAAKASIDLSSFAEPDIKIAREYFVESMNRILEPRPLKISFADNFNSDEERITHCLPLAAEALKSGRAGHKVASEYFVLVYKAAMRIMRYDEAIVATYGMAAATLRPYEYVEKIKTEIGKEWFNKCIEESCKAKAKKLGLIAFSTWYKS